MIGTGFIVGEEATDYANADFDKEKFLELKGVDSGGEYWYLIVHYILDLCMQDQKYLIMLKGLEQLVR